MTGSFELKTKISGVWWRWVIPIGIGVAVLTYMLAPVLIAAYLFVLSMLTGSVIESDSAQLDSLGRITAVWGLPVLNFMLTVPAAAWVARKAGSNATLHGVLVGLISAVGIQLIDLSYGPLLFDELTRMFIVSVGAGWLGGSLARAALSVQKALYRTSRTISSARSPQAMVNAIGEHLADPEQVRQVSLWRFTSQEEDDAPIEVELLTAWKLRTARALPSGLRLGPAQIPALARLQQSPVSCKVRELPVPERDMWEQRGIRSILLIPLVTSSDARVGLLMVTLRKIRILSRSTVRAYLTIASQVALALENLRLLEQERQAGVLRERQRLAHEIHDTLAQGFSSIVMKLEVAEEILPTDPAVVQGYLDQARHTARDSLAEARSLMWALRPESLERASLPEALARLAERWSQECGAAVSAAVNGTPRSLAPEIEVALFRITQEALANCRKYAKASKVSLTLSYLKDLVALDIQDDGVGFDPARPHATTGTSDHSGGVRVERDAQAGRAIGRHAAG
jgi:signal transduction histidine kinase